MFYNHELEREIIGNLLHDVSSIVEVVGELRPDDFESRLYGEAYRNLENAFATKSPTDLPTIAKKSNIPPNDLAECLEAGWFSANIKAKATAVIDLANRRNVFRACQEICSQISNMETKEITARLSDIAASISLRNEQKKVYSGDELARMVYKSQEARYEEKTYIRGIRTGFRCLDTSIRGLRPKRITVIAAGTGFGKTTLALNIFANVIKSGHRALFLSNENDVEDNLDRLCGIFTGVDIRDVESGLRPSEVTSAINDAMWQKPVYLSDNSPRNIDELVATISRYVTRDNIEIAFVDYIGEISGDARDRENEEMKLARYAQRLTDCAKSLNIHIIVLAQMNRQGNKGRPTKTDLGGCFRIAQKAHSLLVFWQDENKQDIVTVDKNRQGPPGADIAVKFDRNTQKIKELGIWLADKGEIYKPELDD